MSKVEEIEKAVSALPPGDLAKFRAWFEAFEAEQFDRHIAGDVAGGRLDRLGESALDDLKSGRTRDL